MTDETVQRSERALKVLIAEYQQANAEIVARLKMQKQVERLILIVVGFLVAGSAFIVEYQVFFVLPLSTILFCILTISFFEQDINITVIAKYSHNVLRPSIRENVGNTSEESSLVGWESFRKDAFLNASISKYLTINRTSLLYIPPLVPTCVFIYLKYYAEHQSRAWSLLENASMAAASVGLIAVVYFAIKVPRLYYEIAPTD